MSAGIARLHAGRPAQALAAFEQAMAWQQANPDALYYMARALTDLGEAATAAGALEVARERFPGIFVDAHGGAYPDPGLDRRALIEGDAIVLRSHADMARGIELLDQDRPGDAVAPLLDALQANPWNVHAYYYLAQAFAHSDQPRDAETVLAKAIDDFPTLFKISARFGEYQGLALDWKTTLAYYNVLGRHYPDVVTFLRSDPPPDATIAARFADAAERWKRGDSEPPALAEAMATRAPDGAAALRAAKKVLLVAPRHTKANPAWAEWCVSLHMAGTGRRALARFEVHHAERFHTEAIHLMTSRSDAELAAGIAALRAHIARMRPDVVVLESNFIGGRQCISREDFQGLKTEFGFKLANVVVDANPPLPNYADYWSAVSDLVLALNEDPYLVPARARCKVVVWPSTPIDLDLMGAGGGERDLGVLFLGARKRYRDLWCAGMMRAGLPFAARFTAPPNECSLPTADYVALHARAKLVLNNGLISSGESATNFRIFEAIASGAVLLQQDFAKLHDFYAPYIHYAPFTTVGEMVATARVLLDRPDLREGLAEAALGWHRAHYGGETFWGRLLEEIFPV